LERKHTVCRQCQWWGPLPCLPPLVTASHLHLTSLDSSELGPGSILSLSGPSGSASTGPTDAYPSTPASSSSSYSTSNDPRGSSSNSATSIGGHSSNTGAIAGGVAGGIAAISIVVVALLFYLRRRRAAQWIQPTYGSSSSANVGSGNHRVIIARDPETTTSLLRPYVCVFVAPAPLMCAHVIFFYPIPLRTRMTQLRTQRTKELRRLRHIILIYRLPRQPAEIYSPLPPRRTPKDWDSDIMAFPLSELTVRNHRSSPTGIPLLSSSLFF
jgi:hypothetical protein